MITNPFISIIIPVYNAERFVEDAIQSVLDQDYPSFEVIVIDDGSTDKSASVIQLFGNQVRHIYQPHTGPAPARNKGLSLANGDWIAFQDADDLWLPDKLRKQVDYLSANTEMDACIGLVEHFWEKGYPVSVDFRQDLLEKPQVGYFIQNLLAQKAVFDRVGTFNSDIYAGQGMDWFARARDAKAKIGIVNEVLLRKRWHDTNIALHHFSFNTTFFRILRQSVKRRRGGTTK